MQSRLSLLMLTVIASFGLASHAQAQSACTYTGFAVSGFGHGSFTNVFVPPAGGTGTFSFTFSSGSICSWAVSHNGNVAAIQGASQGTGSGSVQFSTSGWSGSGTTPRFDTFTLSLNGKAVQSFNLNQESPNCPAPVPTPASQQVPVSGGTYSFTTPYNPPNADCWFDGYAASAGVNVLGAGDQVVNYSIGPNSGPARSLFITIQYPLPGLTFTINQDGVAVAPTITSLSQSTAAAGGPQFNLTVGGSNLSGGTVKWNGASLSTSGSSTQLTAVVPASLIASAGSVAITVTTTGGTSGSLPFTITPPTNNLTPSPASLSFNGIPGGPTQTSPLSLSWTGSGSGTYNLEVTPVGGWLSTSSAQVTISNSPISVTVSASPSTLQAGTASGSIKLTPLLSGNPTVTIPVTFAVTGPVTLSANPSSLTFTGLNGAAPAAKTLSFAGFTGTATLKATSDVGTWLIVPGQTAVPGSISVSVSPGSLQAGHYNGQITVTPSQAGVPPLVVQVALELGGTPSLTLAPNPLVVHYRIGDPLPLPQQTISAFTTGSSLSVPATLQIAAQSWLPGAAASGNTPLALPFTISPSGLGAGTYTASVTATSTQASPSTLTAQAIVLVVDPAPTSQLQVSQTTIVFHTSAGAPASSGQLILTNAGGTTNYTAELKECGCLSITSGATGTVTPTSPGVIAYSMVPPSDPAGGSYFARLVIHSPGNPDIEIPASILATATATPQLIVLGQTGMDFTVVEGSTAPISQTVAILNGGSGTLNAVLTPSTLSGGSWLTAQGTVTVAPTTAPLASITVNPSNLTAGRYTGRVDVSSTTAGNSPQSVAVAVNVVAKGSNVPPEATPGGFIFLSSGEQPADQNVTLTNRNTFPTIFNSTIATDLGGSWLTMTPGSGTVAAGGTVNAALHVNPQGLNIGVFQGTLTIVFSDGTQRILHVSTHIFPPTASDVGGLAPRATCNVTSVQATLESPLDGFSAVVGHDVPLRVFVTDNCKDKDPFLRSDVQLKVDVVPFSDPGNTPISLVHSIDNTDPANPRGVFTGTWTPQLSSTSRLVQANANVSFNNNPNLIGADADVNNRLHRGAVSSLGDPVIAKAANSASQNPPSQASPGLSVTLKGDSLSALPAASALNNPSLATTLADVQVLVGGVPRPIQYTSAGQINFLVPFDNVNPNAGLQVQVKRGNLSSPLFNLEVTNVTPAIYTMSSDGLGQAAVLVANAVEGGHAVLAATQSYGGLTSRPVRRGETIAIYSTGLGAVNNPPSAGQPASSVNPLSQSTLKPTVIFGNATVGTKSVDSTSANYFSGLAPGFIGLYQINVQVPANAPTGTVDLQLLFPTNGAVSNVVQIAVQ